MKKLLFLALIVIGGTITTNAQTRGAYHKNDGAPELARVVKLEKASARGNSLAAAKLELTKSFEENLDESMYVEVTILPTGVSQNRLVDGALLSVGNGAQFIGKKVVASVDFGQHENLISFTNRQLLVDSATNVPGKATKPYKFNSVIGVLNYFSTKGFVVDREMGGKGVKFGRFGKYILVKAGM